MIEQALNAARFNKSKAAKALGLTRHQLYIRMKKYRLRVAPGLGHSTSWDRSLPRAHGTCAFGARRQPRPFGRGLNLQVEDGWAAARRPPNEGLSPESQEAAEPPTPTSAGGARPTCHSTVNARYISSPPRSSWRTTGSPVLKASMIVRNSAIRATGLRLTA